VKRRKRGASAFRVKEKGKKKAVGYERLLRDKNRDLQQFAAKERGYGSILIPDTIEEKEAVIFIPRAPSREGEFQYLYEPKAPSIFTSIRIRRKEGRKSMRKLRRSIHDQWGD